MQATRHLVCGYLHCKTIQCKLRHHCKVSFLVKLKMFYIPNYYIMIWYVINVQNYSNWIYFNVSLISHWISGNYQPVSWLQMTYPQLDEYWIRNLVSQILNAWYLYRIDYQWLTYIFDSNRNMVRSS